MDEMGFTNVDRVYAMAQRGMFSTLKKDSLTVNQTALNMMIYMAMRSINVEDSKAVNSGKPYWVYWGGWTKMAAELGFTLVPMDMDDMDEEDAARVTVHTRNAINRLSRTARFLQDRGAIKLLRPASTIGMKRNATWLLLLGDESENAAAEAWARKCLRLPAA